MALIHAPVIYSFFSGLIIMKLVEVEEEVLRRRRRRVKVGASILLSESLELEGILYH
jgi:hypothetical protein